MPQGGDRNSHTAIIAARERERTIISLYTRGVSLAQIGRQLALAESTVRSAFNRALKRFPKVDVKNLRNLEGERIQNLRFRLWNEMAGRERLIDDPDNPGQKKKVLVRPEPELVVDLIDKRRALRDTRV